MRATVFLCAFLSLVLTARAVNPIISDQSDWADPCVMEHNNTLYLYPTGDQTQYEVFTFDLKQKMHPSKSEGWVRGPTVFKPSAKKSSSCLVSRIPGLGNGSLVWAPHVIYHSDSAKFIMYYSICLEVWCHPQLVGLCALNTFVLPRSV